MLNVPDLERRWKRYRRSKQIPYVIAGSISAILAGGLIAFFLAPDATHPPKNNYPVAVASTHASSMVSEARSSSGLSSAPNGGAFDHAKNLKTALPAPAMSTVQKKSAMSAIPTPMTPNKKSTELKPSMGFMQDFESDVMQYYFQAPQTSPSPTERAKQTEIIPTQQENESLPSISPDTASQMPVESDRQTTRIEETPLHSDIQQNLPAKQMVIQRENDMKDIQDVISRFKKNKNPALSLFVAKRYYKIGNYQQAYNYALITNELDTNIEDSWLIFAKSLYKLDQKDMAIKTLKTYLQDSGSVKAKITLDQMEKGNFK
jgi:hypothetical protein